MRLLAVDLWEGVLMQTQLRHQLAFVILAIAVPIEAGAATFSDLYFFGASGSDTGNAGPVDGSPTFPAMFGYDPDRFTNAGGTLWSEDFATALGLASAAVASSDGGNNYAVSGAGAGDLTAQIAALSADIGGPLPSTALYSIRAGGNNLLAGDDPAATATVVINQILALSALGAEYFLVGNMADISPLAPGGGPLGPVAPIPPGAGVWASDFNTALSAGLATLSGVTIYEYDSASVINALIADPVGNGFSAGLALCSEDIDCINGIGTEDFLMMDHVHMMSTPHQLIAAGALAVIPEPSTALLVGLGLAALGARRSQRRH